MTLPLDSTTSPPLARQPAFWLLMLLIASCVALGRYSHLARPFDADGAMFIYMGKFVSGGGRWWDGLRDNKLPSVGLITSIPWRAFGANWAAYVTLQTVMSIAGALLLGRLARRHVGPGGFMPAVLCALVYMNIATSVFGGFQLETMQTFFAILAAGAALEAIRGGRAIDAFACGLAAGTAAMLKPTGAAVAAAMWVTVIVATQFRWRKVIVHGVMLALGAMLPIACTLVYLAQTRALVDLPDMLRETARYASETPFGAWDLFKPTFVAMVVAFPLVVRGWVFRRDREDSMPRASRAFITFVTIWAAFEMLGAVAQRRMYAYHFYPLAAPISLLFGAIPRRERVASYAAALVPACLFCVAGAAEVIENPEPAHLAAAQYIVAHSAPGASVWNDTASRLLIESDRPAGSRFPLMFLFSNYDDAPRDYGKLLFADFEARRPRFIVLQNNLKRQLDAETMNWDQLRRSPARARNYRQLWSEIERYVRTNYIVVAQVDDQTVFQRRDRIETTSASNETRDASH